MAGPAINCEEELNALVRMATLGQAAGAKDMEHMDGRAAAFNYIRIAELVKSYAEGRRVGMPILDWGCGYGQVSWLLQLRGVDVVSFDVEQRPARESIPVLNSIKIDCKDDTVALPYESGFFGGVLSVGVLEHVPDIHGSLKEINRILRPGGLLFLFMFPNRYSWAEWIAERRGASPHPVKFTMRETVKVLRAHGLDVESKWRRNFLPRNLTGFASRVKRLYGRFYHLIELTDRVLANTPPTSYLSGVLEFVARKRQ